jgi:hypothetical protein
VRKGRKARKGKERKKTYRKRDVSQADALEEAREAVVVPVPTLLGLLVVFLLVCVPQGSEQRAHGRQHLVLDDAPRRVCDPKENVRHLERGKCEAVVLREELARFAGDEFLCVGGVS